MRMLKIVIATFAALGIGMPAFAANEVVLVAGATGKTGTVLVRTLQAHGYRVRAMARDPGKAAGLGPGIEVVEADVTKPDTLAGALKGATFVVSAVGAGSAKPPNDPQHVDYQGIANLADAARAASVRHFVLMSSIGAGNESPDAPLNKMFGMVLMWKGKGEDHLRKSGVPYTIVRPGGLSDCEQPGKVGLTIAAGDAPLRGSVCRADVARVIADALTNKDASGKTIALISDDKSPPDGWKKSWATVAKD